MAASRCSCVCHASLSAAHLVYQFQKACGPLLPGIVELIAEWFLLESAELVDGGCDPCRRPLEFRLQVRGRVRKNAGLHALNLEVLLAGDEPAKVRAPGYSTVHMTPRGHHVAADPVVGARARHPLVNHSSDAVRVGVACLQCSEEGFSEGCTLDACLLRVDGIHMYIHVAVLFESIVSGHERGMLGLANCPYLRTVGDDR
eukprot:2149217-Rhodomonas_salina.2